MAICLQERGSGVVRTFTQAEGRPADSKKYGFGVFSITGPRTATFQPMIDGEKRPAIILKGKAIGRARISTKPTLPGEWPQRAYCKKY
jgi:hypothetical protein